MISKISSPRKQRSARNRLGPSTASRLLVLAGALLTWPGALPAQTPAGRVVNGTTGQPVPNVAVQYVALQQGMVPLGDAVTDAEGRFQFQGINAPSGAPALLRVDYQGATYSRALPPGQAIVGELVVEIFDAASQPGLIAVKEHAIFLYPAGDTLSVLEQVILENSSSPPRAYVNPQGTYRFTLPGTLRAPVRVSVTGPGGMPINENPAALDRENAYAIDYPVRPGETQVRLDYQMDYQQPFEFSKPKDLPSERTHVVTPGSGVEISGEGLTALGTDPSTGYTAYLAALQNNALRVVVRGEAPASSGAAGDQVEQSSGALVPIPDPVSRIRWVILPLAGLVMLAGFIYHSRRS